MLHEGMRALTAFRQFILYRLEPRATRTDKIPISPRALEPHDAHDASHWVSYEDAEALAATLGKPYGVAFVLTESDPFFCLDLDHVRVGDAWSPIVQGAYDMMPGTCIEVSQSGESLHIWGTTAPIQHRTRPNPDSGCPWGHHAELYTKRRFIALTGHVLTGNAGAQVDLAPLVSAWFKPSESAVGGDEWRTEPLPQWRGPTSDADLIQRALHSSSANTLFGNGVTFSDLWTANADALARRWPDVDGYNESHADAALASHLAFWTGCHHERILGLMQQSALVRPKWDRLGYLRTTIQHACSGGKEILQDAPPALPPSAPTVMPPPPQAVDGVSPLAGLTAVGEGAPLSTLRSGRSMLSAEEQRELFAGCVYIRGDDRVYVPGVTYTLKSSQFNATYGGRLFTTADGKLVKSAWEAFTESSVVDFPRVDEEGFDPDRPQGQVYRTDGGAWAVNTYIAPVLEATPGDVGPWWEHLRHLFPDAGDLDSFMAYVCTVVRHPGRKIPWSPLLVSGEGTGKTMMFNAIRSAMGWRYTRPVRAKSLTSQFNGWIGRTLLATVEDFRLPKQVDRDDLLESIKELISGAKDVELEGKGKDTTTVVNHCNFIFACNSLDTLRLDAGSRRFAPYILPLWSKSDLAGAGMDDVYFARLKAWTERPSSVAALRHLFLHWPIPDQLNPLTQCTRAPETTTAQRLYAANMDPIQQIIEEAAMSGLYGLRNGWATSETVRVVLERSKYSITPQASARLLDRMGYVPHPGLENGWTPNPLEPFGKRVKLYIWKHSPYNRAGDAATQVVAWYKQSQDDAVSAERPFGGEPDVTKGSPLIFH